MVESPTVDALLILRSFTYLYYYVVLRIKSIYGDDLYEAYGAFYAQCYLVIWYAVYWLIACLFLWNKLFIILQLKKAPNQFPFNFFLI